LLTRSTGSIIITNDTFNALGNGYISDTPHSAVLAGVHLVTLILGLLTVALAFSEPGGARLSSGRLGAEVSPTITVFDLLRRKDWA
jgi:hypothetical protein